MRPRILQAALVFVGAAGIAGWLVLALVHLGDRYKVGHVQGHWMALARYANEGTLYPPLSDGVRFGGTRHMPLPILANAAAARLTGEYLMSGKAVAVVLFAALLVLVFVVLRQMRCPWPLAVALTGLLPATTHRRARRLHDWRRRAIGGAPGRRPSGRYGGPAARHGPNWLIAAGTLAGLAACSKLTGAMGGLGRSELAGIPARLAPLRVVRRSLAAAVPLLTLGIVLWASEGRFLTNVPDADVRGNRWAGRLDPRPQSADLFWSRRYVAAVWMVGPFAALGTLAAWRSSALTVHHHALAWSLLLTLVVFTDMGAGLNQLLDPAVLTRRGRRLSRLHASRWTGSAPLPLATALALTVIWAGVTGVRGFVPDLREAVAAVRTGETLPKYNPRPLADVLAPAIRCWPRTPAFPYSLGKRRSSSTRSCSAALTRCNPRLSTCSSPASSAGSSTTSHSINPWTMTTSGGGTTTSASGS